MEPAAKRLRQGEGPPSDDYCVIVTFGFSQGHAPAVLESELCRVHEPMGLRDLKKEPAF